MTAVLYPYQRRYLADRSRFKAGMWSRQTGKTFTTTLEAVLDVLEAEAEGRVRRWTIFSVSRDRALDAMDSGVKLHLRAFGQAFEALDEPLDYDALAHMVRLPGGSYIRAIAAKPETARGMSDNLILDEFAHHKDNRAIWGAVMPIISRPDLKVRVISTPNGVGDMFHQIMTDGLSGLFSRHVVTIHDAVADGLPRNVEELRRAAGSAETWAQEYECQFLDTTASAWLPFELIAACQTAQAGQPEGYAGGPCYVGMDIAARGDLTVIAVLEAVGDVLVTRELLALRATFAAQLAELDRIMRHYRVVRAAIDQTGMGEMPVEEARRRHGSYRVEGVLFTASRKLDLAVALKTRMEDRLIRIPAGQALIDDLRSVRAEVGAAGLPRLVAERQGGSHADRFWALALACAAAEDEAPAYDGYRALARRPDVDDDEAARFGGRRMF